MRTIGPTAPLARRKSEPGGVSLLQQRLITELLRDLNVAEAARRCGLSPKQAYQMLEYPAVSAALQTAYRERTERVRVSADDVLRRVALFANADRRELAQVVRVNCRFCWGLDHRYQFTQNELREQIQHHKFMLKERGVPEEQWPAFDDQGGDGFRHWRDPHSVQFGQDHDCPECDGRGVERVWIHDSRFYSEAAKAIFGGVKMNARTGEVAIVARERPVGEELLMRHLGMLNDRETIKTINPEMLTDDELDPVLEAIVEALKDDPEAAQLVLPAKLLEHVKK